MILSNLSISFIMKYLLYNLKSNAAKQKRTSHRFFGIGVLFWDGKLKLPAIFPKIKNL